MKTKAVAKQLQGMGQEDDTILAHINPEEAAMLKMHGGSGKKNPKTGLLSFGYGDGIDGGYDGPAGSGANFGGDVGGFAGNTDAQDARNLLNFDRSQPAPMNQGMATLLGIFGGGLGKLGVGAYNAFDAARVANNSGAGYGSGWGYVGDGTTGNAAAPSESGYGGDYIGGTVPNMGTNVPNMGTAGLLAPVAMPAYVPPAFIPKFGTPRGMSMFTDPYVKARRGLLGG
jgi:hypothetical protein